MRGAQKAVKEASGMLYVGKKKNDCAIKSACSERLIAWRKKESVCMSTSPCSSQFIVQPTTTTRVSE